MSNTIYLYLKTHNKTGLKYLGKTVQDPFKYRGSGKRWINHINHHGYDVSTEILFQSTDANEIKEKGIYYSNLWHIVESTEFANLKIEEGDGGWLTWNKTSEAQAARLKGRKSAGGTKNWTEESYEKVRDAGRKSFLGKRHTDETKKIISEKNKIKLHGENNPSYGKVWCVLSNAKDYSERKLFEADNIPDGWISTKDYREQNKDKNNNAYGRGWYNDGKKNYLLKKDDSKINNLIKGRIL